MGFPCALLVNTNSQCYSCIEDGSDLFFTCTFSFRNFHYAKDPRIASWAIGRSKPFSSREQRYYVFFFKMCVRAVDRKRGYSSKIINSIRYKYNSVLQRKPLGGNNSHKKETYEKGTFMT